MTTFSSRGFIAGLFSVLLAGFWSASSAEETKQPERQSYIKELPKDGAFRIVVLGDSLANGLHQGLTQLNKKNDLLKTTRKSKVNTGLVRVDRYDWNRGAKKIAASKKYDIAIVLLGLNDLQSIREKGKAHHFQTDGWVKRYVMRTENMMNDLKKSGMAVYWTGIPITSPKRYQKEYAYLNGIYKKAAENTDVRFIDTWTALADANGQFTPYWKTPEGKKEIIRHKDGVHFSPDGYQIFAGIVNDIIQADIKDVQNRNSSQ